MRLLLFLPNLALLYSCSHQPAPSLPPPASATEHSVLTIAALDSAMFSAFNANDADRHGTFLLQVG